MKKEEILSTLSTAAQNGEVAAYEFAQRYFASVPDGAEVDNRVYSEAYKTFRAQHPDVSQATLDKEVQRLTAVIERYAGVKLRLTPGTRTGNRPGRKPKSAAVAKTAASGNEAAKVSQPQAIGAETGHLRVQFPAGGKMIDLQLPYPLERKDVERLRTLIDVFYQ